MESTEQPSPPTCPGPNQKASSSSLTYRDAKRRQLPAHGPIYITHARVPELGLFPSKVQLFRSFVNVGSLNDFAMLDPQALPC